jgi:hypothetical protein
MSAAEMEAKAEGVQEEIRRRRNARKKSKAITIGSDKYSPQICIKRYAITQKCNVALLL